VQLVITVAQTARNRRQLRQLKAVHSRVKLNHGKHFFSRALVFATAHERNHALLAMGPIQHGRNMRLLAQLMLLLLSQLQLVREYPNRPEMHVAQPVQKSNQLTVSKTVRVPVSCLVSPRVIIEQTTGLATASTASVLLTERITLGKNIQLVRLLAW